VQISQHGNSLIVTFVVGIALVGCSPHEKGSGAGSSMSTAGSGSDLDSSNSPAPATATMSLAAAEAKARGILQRQIDATKAHDGSMKTMFTPDAVVFTHDKATTVDGVTFFGLADGGPDGVQTDKATIAKVLAGGNANVVWFYAEVATESTGPDGKGTGTTRVVEVATAAEQWRVVAASFGEAGELAPAGDNREIENATAADGPLAKLLGAPDLVGAQLAANAIVVGPKAATQGARSRDTLASWKLEPMNVYKRAREMRTATWGFAQANLDHHDKKYTDRLAGMIVAVPEADGRWSVVLAQYVGQ